MPELPEVETTRRGLIPLVVGETIKNVSIRERRLRWPIEPYLAERLRDQSVTNVSRRGKYLLVSTTGGTLLLHLGMSGSLRYLASPNQPSKHDHVDLEFSSGALVRFNDPRRFGSLHFSTEPERHWLLKDMGPEPLGPLFTPEYLRSVSKGRRVAIKQFLMNARIVAGVGNIYANESLFRASIHPSRSAGRISCKRLDRLVRAVRAVLNDAITAGGTTLQDFVGSDGRPGYFQLSLDVYDKAGEGCRRCTTPITVRTIGQRATYYCPRCQR